MRNRKRAAALMLSATLFCSSFSMTGCGLGSSKNQIEMTATTIYGMVDSVDDSTITITLGSVSAQSQGNGQGEAPSQPDGETSDTDSGEPPAMPSDAGAGESGTDTQASGAPDAPSGEAPSGNAPSGNMGSSSFTSTDTTATLTVKDDSVLQDITLDDISEGTILEVVLDEDGKITSISEVEVTSESQGTPGESGTSSGVTEYTSVNEYTEDTTIEDETFSSTGTDENAILVSNGATVTLNNITLDRTSDDSTGGDNASFYGVGAGLLTTDGTTYVNGGNFTTDSAGGAGVFSYGDGITYIANAIIKTVQNTSGGIHAAGGGTVYAWDLDVETNGESAAAIRSDRGGGTMVIDGGTYTSNGTGSPAVYCTADIDVNNATLTATGSEAVCIEGLNTLQLFDCDVTSTMPDNDQNDCTWSVILYQSMSGDSEVGKSTYNMTGGTLTSKNGGLFYTTNTEADILLSDVDITYSDDDDFFLQVTGNTNERGWGTSGENGSQCIFTGDSQEMKGKIIYDSISTLDFYMTNGSTLTGSFVDDETYAGDGGDGYCNVYVGEATTWVVTDNSEIDDLYAAGTIQDTDGKTVTIVGSDGTSYVEGDSEYTITVKSYSTDDKSSDALEKTSFEDYAVEKPSELS